jgi:hypothetical protein
VSLADTDLIDGDLFELAQLGLAKAPLERPGLDVLDGVPADLQVLGHVLDGHVLRQFQGIALEGPRVVLLGVGKAQFDLPTVAARETEQARHLEGEDHRLAANRQGAKGAFDATPQPNVVGAAVAAAEVLAGPVDAKGHATVLEGLVNIVIAMQPKGVVQ